MKCSPCSYGPEVTTSSQNQDNHQKHWTTELHLSLHSSLLLKLVVETQWAFRGRDVAASGDGAVT